MTIEFKNQTIPLVAPGPGTWLQDSVHVPRPFSRFQTEIHPPNVAAACRDDMRKYGLLIDTLDWRILNGFAYFSVPPAPAEEVPARIGAAEQAVAGKLWREDMERWEKEVRPAAIKAHFALQAVEPRTLSQEQLLDHIDRCRKHQQRMVRQHHSFNMAALIPMGDFIAQAGGWTGLPAGEILALTRGVAPESAGSFAELDRLVVAIQADPSARTELESGAEPGEILNRLRATPGDAGAAASAYLDIVSYRLLDSLDVGDPCAIEVPEVLVKGIRLAVNTGAPTSSAASEKELARVRAVVPAEHRAAFDELLAEARFTSRLRDERGLYSDVWAGGLTRRAILAAGERLAKSGRIADPTHLVEADYEELQTLLRSGEGPSAAELAGRKAYRATYRASDMPPFLGSAPEPPPALDGLPPAVARLMRATITAIGSLFGEPTPESDAMVVRGMGASPGVFTGTARLVDGPAEFGRIEPGDVLVTASTTEAFNIVLPLLGAVVTDAGGVLSHAAIVSREYGIPAVVGSRDATSRIADGVRVRVDGFSGQVTVLAS